jgi:DNA-binding XRE family transcriptional regulator
MNPVDTREIEIGKRLTEAREEALVSQTALAVRIQIARERLVKYEAGIVPLQFWPGLAACSVLDINQCWLATGVGPQLPYIALDWKRHLVEVPKRALFSRVFDERLKKLVEPNTMIAAALDDMLGWESSLDDLYRSVTFAWLQNVNASRAGEFVIRLARAADKILKDLAKKGPLEITDIGRAQRRLKKGAGMPK